MSDHVWTCGLCGHEIARSGDYSWFLGAIQSHPAHCMTMPEKTEAHV